MHMFKEEMRLFPMMEQGGNTLLWQLVDAMRHPYLTDLNGDPVMNPAVPEPSPRTTLKPADPDAGPTDTGQASSK